MYLHALGLVLVVGIHGNGVPYTSYTSATPQLQLLVLHTVTCICLGLCACGGHSWERITILTPVSIHSCHSPV